ncbi:MAG: hypothetical protein QM736_21040 [Vicinamibacterales bacterium]
MGLFRNVPVAESVFRIERLPAGLASHPRGSLTLGWQDRIAPRSRYRTDDGVEFGMALPRGTILREGDCLPIDRPALVIVVQEKPEAVLVAAPQSAEQGTLWAYYIGNSHQPLMLEGGRLICPDVKGMDDVFAFHGIPFERETRAFTPVAAGPSHHG